MTDEECKFLHPAQSKKYMENPKRSCRAQWKGTIQKSANILGPQVNVRTLSASEYISRAQGASKPNQWPRNQIQLPKTQINNKLWLPYKICLTTAPTLVKETVLDVIRFLYIFFLVIKNCYGIWNNIWKFQVSTMKTVPMSLWHAFEDHASST